MSDGTQAEIVGVSIITSCILSVCVLCDMFVSIDYMLALEYLVDNGFKCSLYALHIYNTISICEEDTSINDYILGIP